MPFLFQNKLHWHIYRLCRGRTVSEKLPIFFAPFNSSVTASWISANFQLGEQKIIWRR